jgi:hypothetical protein
VLDAYRQRGGQIDDTLRERIDRFWEAREFNAVQLSIDMNDQSELEDSLDKVRNGAVLKPRATERP